MANQKLNPWQRQAIFEQWGGKCAYCDKMLHWDEFEIDHIIPKSKKNELDEIKQKYDLPSEFDLNSYDNLTVSCTRCNKKKSDKILPIFISTVADAQSKSPKIEKKVIKLADKHIKTFHKMQFEAAVEQGIVSKDDVMKMAIKYLPALIQEKVGIVKQDINLIAIQCFETIKTSYTDPGREVVAALKWGIGNLLFVVFIEGMVNGQWTDKGLLAISFTATLVTGVCIKVTESNKKRNGERVWNYS
ncbi:HNH endonuclease [Laspinema olomoucense]|uniref:HNH endonuclease n=1 Tax=Laspinema olomoucense TaxID=3231600 RepID=UPI0021BBA53B|nr:HNH endonuclease signature motif containing protein [Laspinema sp. D3c]MCT7994089.1 HNH endonuclease [Laspinema sp. D3c]